MSDGATLAIPRGFRASGIKAGLKASGSLDMAVLVADGPCAAAGTFTTNRVCAAPVKWCREHLPADDIRAIVINSGNANAATGSQGLANARRTAERAAALLGCRPEQIAVASTGIIGHQLPMAKIEAGIATAVAGLSANADAFQTVAASIMTTDTRPKIVSMRQKIAGKRGDASGYCQGSCHDRPADGDDAGVLAHRRTPLGQRPSGYPFRRG